jgi:hypothetical protein
VVEPQQSSLGGNNEGYFSKDSSAHHGLSSKCRRSASKAPPLTPGPERAEQIVAEVGRLREAQAAEYALAQE